MRKSICCVVLSSLVGLTAVVHAGDAGVALAVSKVAPSKRIAPKDGAPWELVKEKRRVKIWTRDVPNSRVREVKVEATIRAPVERVWDVISKVEEYTDFMPYIEEVLVSGDAGPNSRFVYHRIDPPFVSARDYTLRVTSEVDKATGRYYRYWTPENSKGPGPKEGVIRLEVCDGSWVLEKIDDNKTKAVYWVYTDPGGSIPTWLANKANKTSLPDVIKAVEKRSIDPTWTR